MRKVKENKGKDEKKGGNKIGKPKRGGQRDGLLGASTDQMEAQME